MKSNLILIEGIPGSGKTTTAKRLRDYLDNKSVKVKLYSEGDAHPTDLAWNAYVPLDEYNLIIDNNPEYKNLIRDHTMFEGNYALVAYTKLGLTQEEKLMKYFEEHEVYDGRVSLDTFRNLLFERWKRFGLNAEKDTLYIFECSFLQNHINELMGSHDKSIDFIADYMINLIENVMGLNPKLIYLNQPDTYETIKRVAKERVSPDKSKWPDWIDLVIKYTENCHYGKKHFLKGFDGVIEFFEARRKVELAVLDKLPIDKAIITNPEYKWDDVFAQVLREAEVG